MASLKHLHPKFQNVKTLLLYTCDVKSFASLQVVRSITTNTVLYKRTPHTVRTMSWVRAARRRKHLEQKMKDTEKTEHEVLKEEQLARTSPEIEFRLPSYKPRPIDDNVMNQLHIKPEVFLSRDRETIICYHPPPRDYPFSHTKHSKGISLFDIDPRIIETFKSRITNEEIMEGLKLRDNDAHLWDTNALAKLFRVKPDVVKANIPISKEQEEMVKAEKELFKSMSAMKRRQVRDLQRWERLKYIKETRGKKDAKQFDAIGLQPAKPSKIPPKF